MVDEPTTALTIDFAKRFMLFMQRVEPRHEQAFLRFRKLPSQYGSNASYVAAAKVHLVSALTHSDFFRETNERGKAIFEASARRPALSS